MTLSLHLNPDEYFFGQTNVSTDYIFSGATTTARWLFTFKFWIVAYEMPKIFVVGAEVKNRNKVYVRLNILAIALINIPWLIICVQSSSSESFIKQIIAITWLDYLIKLIGICFLLDAFRRLCVLEKSVPILRVKKRELTALGYLILLWVVQWVCIVFEGINFTAAYNSRLDTPSPSDN